MAKGSGARRLFDLGSAVLDRGQVPLAARMRPSKLDQFVGQEHLLGPGQVLRRAIENHQVPSMVLWGPPGVGKTTLAYLIARATAAYFASVSAVSAGVADLRRMVSDALERRTRDGKRTVLFVDEVHRFSKAQQDVVLPDVEDGTVIFIGATTENPSFGVTAPLLSRSRVLVLKPLGDEQLDRIVERALSDPEQGLGGQRIAVTDGARRRLKAAASGDARVLLSSLELAVSVAPVGADGWCTITETVAEEVVRWQAATNGQGGAGHYDTSSAFIKSVRASDPDAAIYWLARMLESGEDPLYIARRIVVLAAEDVGMADPQALPMAVAAQQAVHFLGLPEGAIPLAEAAIYLATAPKSNTVYRALNSAVSSVRSGPHHEVPLHLRNGVTTIMRQQGYGQGYRYAHDYPGHFANQRNLPLAIEEVRFYEPSDQGYEREVASRIVEWWGSVDRRLEGRVDQGFGPEGEVPGELGN